MENVVKNESVTEDSVSEDQTQEAVNVENKRDDATTNASQSQAGSKTDSALLLQSLKEEREKRRELEDKLKELESLRTSDSSTEVYSDEGLALKTKIDSLEKELTSLRDERLFESVLTKHPEIKEAEADFKEFAKDYPVDKLDSVAKIFIVEKGLDSKPRKGLEKTSGGGKRELSSSFSTDEIADLRKNNYKKYLELLKSGKLNPKDIK